jgi:hypothetical protein
MKAYKSMEIKHYAVLTSKLYRDEGQTFYVKYMLPIADNYQTRLLAIIIPGGGGL